MNKYYLAIDIGASSGRHILGSLENGKIVLEEIYRFPNEIIKKDNELTWDIDALFNEVLNGMKKCKELNKIPESVGIDTWAVDIVLLDENDSRIGNVMSYRDNQTREMDEEVYKLICEDKLYERTGIQKQMFNTIYQLMAWKKKRPHLYDKAKTMLMIPDYLHYLLSNKKVCEYTNATTTQLVSPITKNWDDELIELLDYKKELFQEIVLPGTYLGNLTKDIQEIVGFDCKVVIPATHDTGSAVMAVPVENGNSLYISSGTWSLMGCEIMEANCSPISKEKNFTNEGGYDYRFRYLKNIMGLWMIQSVKKEIGQDYNYQKICELASDCNISSIVDVNDQRFMAPESMVNAIQSYCEETNQKVPSNLGEIAAVIYNSLAKCYSKTIDEIEEITHLQFDSIHIVGGGSNADYLNRLTAKESNRTVYAGPSEATAIGNLTTQMIAANELADLNEARKCIGNSFDIQIYK